MQRQVKKNVHHHIYENKGTMYVIINGHKTDVQKAITKKKEKYM